MELRDMISGMLDDVAKGKHKKPRKKRNVLTNKVDRQPGMQSVVNPWTEEALVLVMTVTTCDSCGNEGTSWENGLFIERHNRRRALPITQIERLDRCHYSSVYGGLPKRIEVLEKTSCTCPQCFGIADSNHDKLVDEINPLQLQLFNEELPK